MDCYAPIRRSRCEGSDALMPTGDFPNCLPTCQQLIQALEERVAKLERKEMFRTDKRLGPSPDSPSPYDLSAISRRKKRG